MDILFLSFQRTFLEFSYIWAPYAGIISKIGHLL